MRGISLGTLATIGGLALSADTTTAQGAFSADSAVAGGADFGVTARAGASNVAVGELFTEYDAGDEPQLARQQLLPVGLLARACDCLSATTVVCMRMRSHLEFSVLSQGRITMTKSESQYIARCAQHITIAS